MNMKTQNCLENKDALYIFSCVIMSTDNTEDLNESMNIKNPYGIEKFDSVFELIYLSLLACTVMPIYLVILDIRIAETEKLSKIVLDKNEIQGMTKEDIKEYLKTKTYENFLI